MTAKADTQPLQVVIIARADGLEQDWIAALQAEQGIEVLARLGVLKRGVEAVELLRPALLVIDRDVEEIEETLHQVYAVAPNTLCVGVLPEEDMAAVRRLVAAGARDILAKPLQPKDMVASLRQVVQMEAVRRERVGLPTLQAERQGKQAGKVIVVMGAKGGVGTTTIATNVALALKQVSGKDVALADFSLQFGDVAALLNVWSKHTLHDLAIHHQTLDDALLDRVLTAHGSGVKLLQAPAQPEQAGDIQGAQVTAIVKQLRARFDYVVIDCWSFLDEITETLMGLADQVLLVTTPEVPALKNSKRALDYFAKHGLQSERVAVVLNRYPSVKGITVQEVQEHLGHPIKANLPSDGPAVTYAVNKGVPFVQSQPKSWVAQSCFKLAGWLAGEQVATLSEAPAEQTGAKVTAKRRFALRRASA